MSSRIMGLKMRDLQLGDLHADVVRKNIKHVHLSVYPPDGRVRISAPLHMALATVRMFAITKLDWIRKQQRKLRAQTRETPREYIDKESHFVWGRRYLLCVIEEDKTPAIVLKHATLELHVRPGSDVLKRHEIMQAWYREQIKNAVPALLQKWEPALSVKAQRIFVQHMKTRWGSCNTRTAAIRLNTDLARKPMACLEYVLVHELLHLIEPSHNARFKALMDEYVPHWREFKNMLNRLPVRHEDWDY